MPIHQPHAIAYLLSLPKADLEAFLSLALRKMDAVLLDTLLGDWQFEVLVAGQTEEVIEGLLGAFEERSQSGAYYKPFFLDAKSFTYVPPETELWFAEISRWLDYGAAQALSGNKHHAFNILGRCIQLLDDIANDNIVFADEPGEWMLCCKHDFRKIYDELAAQ